MKVILLERVAGLGDMGKEVQVKNGFARNFLLPRAKALRATAANIEFFQKKRAEIEAKNAETRAKAEELAKRFQGASVTVARQASEDGKLYGSVAARDIAAELIAQGTEIDRKLVELDAPIRTIGSFRARIVLHPEVVLDLPVRIVRSTESLGEASVATDTDTEAAETTRA